jgi:hypothetical protein
VVAMLWVSWVGRERREPDREEAVRRMGAALEREPRVRRTPPPTPPRERSSGVAQRRTAARPPVPERPVDEHREEPGDEHRRAS